MPVLNVQIDGKWLHAEAWEDRQALLGEVLGSLSPESDGPPYYSPGNDAWFMFSDTRHTGEGGDIPDNFLRVSLNRRTGFGALVWGVNTNHPVTGGIFDHVWVSHNPNPPGLDPRVVADPGEPRFHSPDSAIPVIEVHGAVEEFCRLATGYRPECIGWVRGHLSGHRLEAAPE